MKKKKDDRSELLIRFRIDNDNKVHFIDPCCDTIPAMLFCLVMKKISEAEKEWNNQVTIKNNRHERYVSYIRNNHL